MFELPRWHVLMCVSQNHLMLECALGIGDELAPSTLEQMFMFEIWVLAMQRAPIHDQFRWTWHISFFGREVSLIAGPCRDTDS